MDTNTWLPIVLSLISGGVGGNIAGALLKKFSLGPVGNSIAGILGGGIGGQLLSYLAGPASGMVGNIGGSAVGGAILMAIVGAIKSAMAKQG